MDIDTSDSPPIAAKPYSLSLKHYKWVQKEIDTLKQAGIITLGITSGSHAKEISTWRTSTEKDVC